MGTVNKYKVNIGTPRLVFDEDQACEVVCQLAAQGIYMTRHGLFCRAQYDVIQKDLAERMKHRCERAEGIDVGPVA